MDKEKKKETANCFICPKCQNFDKKSNCCEKGHDVEDCKCNFTKCGDYLISDKLIMF